MGPQARGRRGGSRGGRGRGRGRGGRGRGGSVATEPSRFTTRLGENESSDEEDSEAESHAASEEEQDLDDSSSDGEDEEKANARPHYMTLLQSFTKDSERNPKRRKLDNGTAAEADTTQQEPSRDDGEGSEEEGRDVDHADEPEEDPADALAEAGSEHESDDEDVEDSSDPFDSHFSVPDQELTAKKVKAIQDGKWASKRIMTKLSKAVLMLPEVEGSADGTTLPSPIPGVHALKLKQKLSDVASRKLPSFDGLQQALAPIMFNYHDVLYGSRNVGNAEQLRQLTCLHAVNHALKTRDRVIKNSYRLSKDENSSLELRDQGFTRPKVLFILPTRQSCAKTVAMIENLWEPDQRENRKRFEEAYVDNSEKFRDQKPADFLELFEGNDDDMFRLGVKFTRKTIKYFAQFYNSDILMASPLGLRMAIGSEEDKKMDYDFLSSIEMVVVDQADGLLMQNWEHVEYVFQHLNRQPRDSHGCDFSRVRTWYLEDWAKHFRQTIILSPFITPELTELFRTQCHNWAGKIRFHPDYQGRIQQLPVRARQTFSRFESNAIGKDPDARFSYFTSAIVPSLAKRARDLKGTLIFVPSYLDFVRVRNYFATSSATEAVTFGTLSEYAEAKEAARARSHFLSGRHKVLLYTERAHHFRRYRLRGVQRVIMYGLPDNPIFYEEIAGGYLARSEQDMRLEPGQGTVRVMFSKYDVMKLERIVGTQRVGKMIQEKGDTFDFV